MPGSDPIPPTKIWQAIQDGADYRAGILMVDNVANRLAIVSGEWALDANGGGYSLQSEAYSAMKTGTVEGGYIVNGERKRRLVPAGSLAVLAPE